MRVVKRRRLSGALRGPWLCVAFVLSACSNDGTRSGANECTPNDQDGVIGGKIAVLLTVSDTGFAVGGVDSGSTQRNITIQNSVDVTLTLTNVGKTPHSFVVDCIPTELPAGCKQKSCFPPEANIDPIDPGKSSTTKFVTPLVEGAYRYSSDVPGDDDLVGQFVID